MSLVVCNENFSRLKSSSALKTILHKSREMEKTHNSKILTSFGVNQYFTPKSSNQIRSNWTRWSDNSSNASQLALKDSRNNIVEKILSVSSRSTSQNKTGKPYFKGILEKPSKNSRLNTISPEFFRKALRTILKVPFKRTTIKRKHK